MFLSYILIKFEHLQKDDVSTKCCIPVFYGDRFIPRRYSLKNCERNLKFAKERPVKDALALYSSADYWRENHYLPTIQGLMEMTQDRILDLIDPVVLSTGFIVREYCQNINEKKRLFHDWPCRPRSKPSALLDSTFALPRHNFTCDPNLSGWSALGHLAICFVEGITIWLSREDVTMMFDVKNISCLAYSPCGKFLAIGCGPLDFPAIELWDVSRSKNFSVISGTVFSCRQCEIKCIQWTSSGDQLVCGTYYGCLYLLSVPDLNKIKKIRCYDRPITILRFSPTMQYLASGDDKGNIIIYNWKTFNVHLNIKSRTKSGGVCIDWHPWTGVDLAISEISPASISILNVASKKIVANYRQTKEQKHVLIEMVSFSKLTGELLVSISIDGLRYVLVMSSLDSVVDVLKVAAGGIKFLMWSPDGTKVATSNCDEELCIWNFCPVRKPKHFKEQNGAKDNSMESKFGHQFRKCNFLK